MHGHAYSAHDRRGIIFSFPARYLHKVSINSGFASNSRVSISLLEENISNGMASSFSIFAKSMLTMLPTSVPALVRIARTFLRRRAGMRILICVVVMTSMCPQVRPPVKPPASMRVEGEILTEKLTVSPDGTCYPPHPGSTAHYICA